MSQKASRPKFLITQVLSSYGASAAMLNELNGMGISLSYSTYHRKLRASVAKHKEAALRYLSTGLLWFDNFCKFYRHSKPLTGIIKLEDCSLLIRYI